MAALDVSLLHGVIIYDRPEAICAEFRRCYADTDYPPVGVYRNLLLCAAIQYGHGGLVDRLLQEEGWLRPETLGYAATRPLHTAVVYGGAGLVGRLLLRGLDVHQEGAAGIWRPGAPCMDIGTPLALVVEKDDPAMMTLLAAAYIPDETRQRLTPLHYACKFNAIKCFQALMAAGGVDVNAQDEQGCTPLMYAVQKNSHLVRYLLNNGADVRKAMHRIGHTALELAVLASRENTAPDMGNIVAQLLAAGADVTRVTSQGEDSPLALLCSNLVPAVQGGERRGSEAHSREVSLCVRVLIAGGALGARCRSNPITAVLQKLYSLAGTLSFTHDEHPWEAAQERLVEGAFALAKDLIALFLQHGVEANTADNRARKTGAAQVLWIIDSRARHSWLAGNPYLSRQQSQRGGGGAILNPKLTASLLAIFTTLLLHGSDITEPPEYGALFNLLRVDFERFLPFLLRFLNSLPHAKWAAVMRALRAYIVELEEKQQQQKQPADRALCLRRLIKPRTLRQLAQAIIVNAVQRTASPIKCVHELPLPTATKEGIIALND